MKRLILIIFIIGIMFLRCKSPADPEIQETLKKADIRVADIRVTVEPNPIAYFNNNVYFTAIFTEHDGVGAELQKLWMLTYHEDESYYVRRSFGWMCPKKLRAKGKLELDFSFYAGRLCYQLEVQARFLDENGHTHEVKRKFSVR